MIVIRQLKDDLRQRFGQVWKKATIKQVAVGALVELARRHVASQKVKHGAEGLLFLQEVAALAMAEVMKSLADHPEPTPEQMAAIQAEMARIEQTILDQVPADLVARFGAVPEAGPEAGPTPPSQVPADLVARPLEPFIPIPEADPTPPVRNTDVVASDFLRDLQNLRAADDDDADDEDFELV